MSGEVDSEGLADSEEDTELEGLNEALPLADPLADGELEGLNDAEPEAEPLTPSDKLGEADSDTDGEEDGLNEADPDTDPEALPLLLGLPAVPIVHLGVTVYVSKASSPLYTLNSK